MQQLSGSRAIVVRMLSNRLAVSISKYIHFEFSILIVA